MRIAAILLLTFVLAGCCAPDDIDSHDSEEYPGGCWSWIVATKGEPYLFPKPN